MPPSWESSFGGFRHFYAPGVQLFARTELNLTSKAAFSNAAMELREKAVASIPEEFKNQVYAPQNDWEKLGPSQINGIFSTQNMGFAKLVVGLVVVKMIAAEQHVKVDVFKRFPIHAAIFHFRNFDARFFREEIIKKEDVLREFTTRVHQKQQFAESFSNRFPATLRTVRVIDAWLSERFPDQPQRTIYAHEERKRKAAEKESVAAVDEQHETPAAQAITN